MQGASEGAYAAAAEAAGVLVADEQDLIRISRANARESKTPPQFEVFTAGELFVEPANSLYQRSTHDNRIHGNEIIHGDAFQPALSNAFVIWRIG